MKKFMVLFIAMFIMSTISFTATEKKNIKIKEQSSSVSKTEVKSNVNLESKPKTLKAVPLKLLPDLEIKLSINKGQLHTDSLLNIVVKNVGQGDTPKSTNIDVQVWKERVIETGTEGSLLKVITIKIDPIKKGKSILKTVKYVFHKAGLYSSVAFVNTGKHKTFTESNTRNNNWGVDFTIEQIKEIN